MLRDITDRKRAEAELSVQRQRFAGIVESAMDAIITIDAGHRVVLFNAAAEAMSACPAAKALGVSIYHFIPERFRAGHSGHIERFGATGTTSRTMGKLGAVYGLRSDGVEFPIEAAISKIEVAGEKLYTVILRDISTRLAAEQEIRRFNTELVVRRHGGEISARAAPDQGASFCFTLSGNGMGMPDVRSG